VTQSTRILGVLLRILSVGIGRTSTGVRMECAFFFKARFQILIRVASVSESDYYRSPPARGAKRCVMEKRGKGRKKESVHYDMVGIFVQLGYKTSMKLEELHASHEELQEYVDELHKKLAQFDKELKNFRDSLEVPSP
jgi:hypothetical protein